VSIDIIGPKEVRHQLDMLQGMAEHHARARQTELMLEWLDLRFPPGNQFRHLVLAVLDTVRSYTLHCWHHADGVPFHVVREAIDLMREAMGDDVPLRILCPREQEDFRQALAELRLYNWHDSDQFACVFTGGAPGTSGNDLSARMVVHREGRAVLEVEVAQLVEWAAWPEETITL
jgi:hypothetical protein